MALRYRKNVAGILVNNEGNILIGERVGQPGAWQFPQGGVDRNESFDQALYRELEEEIGLPRSAYNIIARRDGYRYEFPNGRVKFGIYHGQEQTYYLCRFLGNASSINIDTRHPEFQQIRWIAPQDFSLKWLPMFKRAVYQQVFADFFSVKLELGGAKSPDLPTS